MSVVDQLPTTHKATSEERWFHRNRNRLGLTAGAIAVSSLVASCGSEQSSAEIIKPAVVEAEQPGQASNTDTQPDTLTVDPATAEASDDKEPVDSSDLDDEVDVDHLIPVYVDAKRTGPQNRMSSLLVERAEKTPEEIQANPDLWRYQNVFELETYGGTLEDDLSIKLPAFIETEDYTAKTVTSTLNKVLEYAIIYAPDLYPQTLNEAEINWTEDMVREYRQRPVEVAFDNLFADNAGPLEDYLREWADYNFEHSGTTSGDYNLGVDEFPYAVVHGVYSEVEHGINPKTDNEMMRVAISYHREIPDITDPNSERNWSTFLVELEHIKEGRDPDAGLDADDPGGKWVVVDSEPTEVHQELDEL